MIKIMLLKIGSKGDDVKKLQEKLGLSSDGNFGPNTEKAVKEWQSSNGLTADGVVGDKSWQKLFGNTTETVSEPVVLDSNLKLEKLKGIIPDSVISQIPATAAKFNITNNLRLAHFLSQCAHESGNFKWVTEFASGKAYEGRKDLGNTQPGDGVKFKGRGYIQLTGRVNYTKFSQFCGEDCVSNPELVATKYPMLSAAYFFDKNKLWSICDKGATDDDVKAVTKKVNGGLNGYEDRKEKFHKIWAVLK
jgi:putative chitinase